MEHNYGNLDGTTIYVEANPTPSDTRRVNGALMFVREITQRKRTEQALRDSEERLNLALTAARMGVWEWDLKNQQRLLVPRVLQYFWGEKLRRET